ncbi:hypothetical protein BV210_16545 [Halorientalis sp. IM1011]|uniref:hypothetical protein n=1 Tax=Halorientalis sp. IM1011 TaxID=1932360 RepID=UPI00097CD561|nr:hypothetical protein [Halorientalis sp. IM1011]AQL44222.1 hypothetical protein BV210_16545 [Halorientalis sp. IM1011]
MRRRTYLVGCSTALTAGLAGCTGSSDESSPDDSPADDPSDTDRPDGTDTPHTDPEYPIGLANPSFEDGLDGWWIGKDLPEIPGGGGTVDHGTEVVTERASDGEQAVEFYISGVADDGTIWVEQEMDFSGVKTVTVDAYSEMRSANILSEVAFFAGEKPEGGLQERDFDRSEDVQDHEGWKTYEYSVTELSGTGTLAVGMNVIWETDVRSVFDNVQTVVADRETETTRS